ncbi:MAG: nuclear transport factor 2 family protein [Solirubrobacteraceae bacterium]|jgi:ketosteroid isomerase-like protein
MSQENVEGVRSIYEALARRDLGAIKALAEQYPGFEFESVLTGEVYKGVQGVLDLATDMWETVDYVPQLEEIIDAGDDVISVSRISGRGARSGVPVSQQVGIVWTFDHDTLIRGKSFSSRAAALAAVGLRE